MSVRPILTWPDPRLSQPSADIGPTEYGSDALHELAQDLVDTMAAHEAAGLAAVQIGVHKRVIALALLGEANKGGERGGVAIVLCNPEAHSRSGSALQFDAMQKALEKSGNRGARRLDARLLLEGCLSFPGVTERIDAPLMAVAIGTDVDGSEVTLPLKGTPARALVHEIEHTRGLTMLDKMSDARRKAFLRRYSEARTLRRAG